MSIKVQCPIPDCAKSFSVKEELVGKTGKCPACKTPMTIPDHPSSKADEEKPSAPTTAPATSHSASELLTIPKLIVKRKGGFSLRFGKTTRIVHTIKQPGNKQVLGVVVKETKFDWRKLFQLTQEPLRLDVRESKEGPNVVSFVLNYTFLSKMVAKKVKQINMTVLDEANQPLGEFRYREGLTQAEISFITPEEETLAEVKWQQGFPPGLALVQCDGQSLGTVADEVIAKTADQVAANGGRMTSSFTFGNTGHQLDVHPEVVGNPLVHSLMLGLAIFVETTGIGKVETGNEKPGAKTYQRRRR